MVVVFAMVVVMVFVVVFLVAIVVITAFAVPFKVAIMIIVALVTMAMSVGVPAMIFVIPIVVSAEAIPRNAWAGVFALLLWFWDRGGHSGESENDGEGQFLEMHLSKSLGHMYAWISTGLEKAGRCKLVTSTLLGFLTLKVRAC
jgi:hypothetical protein